MDMDFNKKQDKEIQDLVKEEFDQIRTPGEWKEELFARIEASSKDTQTQTAPIRTLRANSHKPGRPIVRFLSAAAAFALVAGGAFAVQNMTGSSDQAPITASGDKTGSGAEGQAPDAPSNDVNYGNPRYSCRLTELGPDGASGGAGYSSELHKYDGDNCAQCQGLTEYPEEYPVKSLRFEDEAALATGSYHRYSYEHYLQRDQLNELFESLYPGLYLASSGMCEPRTVEAGYDNYFADAGEQMDSGNEYCRDLTNITVSENAFTGKFSFSASYSDEYLLSLPKDFASYDLDELDEGLREKAAAFASNFEAITGKLDYFASEDFEMGFPVLPEGISEKGADSSDLCYVELTGRTYYFLSDYSKESLDAGNGQSLPSASINQMPDGDPYNVFSVTLFPDGKIFSADNTISKAEAKVTDEVEAATKKELEKLTDYLSSTSRDDTLVVKKVSIPSYNNYFGSVEIEPLMRVEYYFESDPTDIRTTDFILHGFKYSL